MKSWTETLKEVPVAEGDTYAWTANVLCRDKSTMLKGSLLIVHRRTSYNPHNEIGPKGFNWICFASNGPTVWAMLESCIYRGLLQKIGFIDSIRAAELMNPHSL